jgi:hypothetical protein
MLRRSTRYGPHIENAPGLQAAISAAPQTLNDASEGFDKERWGAVVRRVSRDSNALDLDPGVFKLRGAKSIAKSLKRSAERSKRKSSPYRSALSMLVLYINRAGRSLSAERRETLERAKDELRGLVGGEPRKRGP